MWMDKDKLVELLSDVARCGAVYLRGLDWVDVQIDVELWDAIQEVVLPVSDQRSAKSLENK